MADEVEQQNENEHEREKERKPLAFEMCFARVSFFRALIDAIRSVAKDVEFLHERDWMSLREYDHMRIQQVQLWIRRESFDYYFIYDEQQKDKEEQKQGENENENENENQKEEKEQREEEEEEKEKEKEKEKEEGGKPLITRLKLNELYKDIKEEKSSHLSWEREQGSLVNKFERFFPKNQRVAPQVTLHTSPPPKDELELKLARRFKFPFLQNTIFNKPSLPFLSTSNSSMRKTLPPFRMRKDETWPSMGYTHVLQVSAKLLQLYIHTLSLFNVRTVHAQIHHYTLSLYSYDVEGIGKACMSGLYCSGPKEATSSSSSSSSFAFFSSSLKEREKEKEKERQKARDMLGADFYDGLFASNKSQSVHKRKRLKKTDDEQIKKQQKLDEKQREKKKESKAHDEEEASRERKENAKKEETEESKERKEAEERKERKERQERPPIPFNEEALSLPLSIKCLVDATKALALCKYATIALSKERDVLLLMTTAGGEATFQFTMPYLNHHSIKPFNEIDFTF